MYVWLALAWCYKRTGRILEAIRALESALDSEPREPILHYNLACYWSLLAQRTRALSFLQHAIDLNSNFRDLVNDEPDFDLLRNDPEFRALTSVIV
jgi:tetratricopeptide (TPR) repeat protein